VLQSMVKKREEAAEQYTKGGREELATKEREEIRIIQDYLPAQMDDESLREAETDLYFKGDLLLTRLLIEPVDEALIIEFAQKVKIPHRDGI